MKGKGISKGDVCIDDINQNPNKKGVKTRNDSNCLNGSGGQSSR